MPDSEPGISAGAPMDRSSVEDTCRLIPATAHPRRTRLHVSRPPAPTMKSTHKFARSLATAGALLAVTSAALGESPSPTGLLFGVFPGESDYDKIWSAATLYKDASNPILQEFALQGRLHIQYADGHSSNGHFDIDDYKNSGKQESVWGDVFDVRRSYFGIRSKWFNDWRFSGQIVVDPDASNGADGSYTFYKNLFDMILTYAPNDAVQVSIGKQTTRGDREYEISSREIVTIERSLAANMIAPNNLTGMWVNGSGIASHWAYEFGVYGNDEAREFSNFHGGLVTITKLGYDWSKAIGAKEALLSLRHVHNTEPGYKPDRTWTNYTPIPSPPYTDSLALSNDMTIAKFRLITEAIYGFGASELNRSDFIALDIIPTYRLTADLELAGRIQLVGSSDPDGVGIASRYEAVSPETNPVTGKRISDSKGNTYFSSYLGLNYYIYGHKLKLMNGFEFSHLGGGDYNGTTYFSALRFAF